MKYITNLVLLITLIIFGTYIRADSQVSCSMNQVTANSVTVAGPVVANSVNGIVNAAQMSGVDIGAKVNSAITLLGTPGGKILIPAGQYSFSTTIQCPLTTNAPIIIEGSGQANSQGGFTTTGTFLGYTGNGDAINQQEATQNFMGCQIRDLTLDGSGAGTNAIGLHIGGTVYSSIDQVAIQKFQKVAIELDNPVGKWTERYNFKNSSLFVNKVGIYFHGEDPSNLTSFGHGDVDVAVNTSGSGQTAIVLDGRGFLYSCNIRLNGNITAPDTVFKVSGGSVFSQGATVNSQLECSSGTCTEFNIDATSGVSIVYLENGQGTYSNTIATGGTFGLTGFANGENGQQIQGGVATLQGPLTVSQGTPNGTGSVINGKNQYTVANGGNTAIANSCSGLILVADLTRGDNGLYWCGGGFCGLVMDSFPGGYWVAPTATPAAGSASVTYVSATTSYNVFNNIGASHSFSVMALCNKQSP